MTAHKRYLLRQAGGVRAKLSHAKLDGLNLANRDLSEADFAAASLVGANVSGSNLEGASFYCADLRNCDLRSSRLPRADLRGASFNGARLAFAMLDDADLRAATMAFSGPGGITIISRDKTKGGPSVDFSNCSLKGASFGNAKLEGANFSGALLQGASFKGARLTNVVFTGAVLTGVNLKELSVPQELLADCIADPKPLSDAEVAAMKSRLALHERWALSHGREGTQLTLDGVDLRALQGLLAGRTLAGLSARNSRAIGLDLSAAQLQAAKFDGADLRDVNFAGADLRGVSLRRARLAHARFDKADLRRLALTSGAQIATDVFDAETAPGQFFGALMDDSPGGDVVML
jgi:uncharacterized protein YjbI with pentapeptide repeats